MRTGVDCPDAANWTIVLVIADGLVGQIHGAGGGVSRKLRGMLRDMNVSGCVRIHIIHIEQVDIPGGKRGSNRCSLGR